MTTTMATSTSLLLLTLSFFTTTIHSFIVVHPSRSNRPSLSLHAASTTELWLDLRKTRLTPTFAVERLEQDLEQVGIVDRIIVGQDDILSRDGGGQGQHQEQVDSLQVDLPANGFLPDPLSAIDTVSRGGWVLIDSDARQDDLERQEGVQSLLQLLLLAGGSSSSLSGDDDDDDGSDGGGVAWTCWTKSDILHAGTAIASLESVESTSSGILLSSSDSATSSSAVQCALMLPFDEVVWKTATLLFRPEEEEFDLEESRNSI